MSCSISIYRVIWLCSRGLIGCLEPLGMQVHARPAGLSALRLCMCLKLVACHGLQSGTVALCCNQVTGHKLRLNIPDTAVIHDGVLKAWVYTDRKTSVVSSTPSSSLSCTAFLHKLKSQHTPHQSDNPCGWVAIAYFSNSITRLVNAEGVEQLVRCALML